MRDFFEDDYDVDKKLLADEIKKTNFEKRIVIVLLTVGAIGWVTYVRHEV